jgi:hypothetical protein
MATPMWIGCVDHWPLLPLLRSDMQASSNLFAASTVRLCALLFIPLPHKKKITEPSATSAGSVMQQHPSPALSAIFLTSLQVAD